VCLHNISISKKSFSIQVTDILKLYQKQVFREALSNPNNPKFSDQ